MNDKLSMMRTLYRIIIVIVVLLTTSCTSHYAVRGESVQAPRLAESHFVGSDGASLPVDIDHAAENPQAVVIAVHGFNDYRGAFELIIPHLVNHHITVYSFDQRGFGQTEQRGYWPGTASLIQDLAELVVEVRQTHPRLPLYLLGDSMGGAVTMVSLLQEDFPEVEGVILNAPAVWGGESFNLFYRGVLWLASKVMPGKIVTGSGVKIKVSDNIPHLRKMGKDPHLIRRTRIDTLRGLVGLMDDAVEAGERFHQTQTPVLFLYGLKDEVIPRRSVCKFMTNFTGQTDYSFYDNGYHLLLRDKNAYLVWEDIVSWIKDRQVNNGSPQLTC